MAKTGETGGFQGIVLEITRTEKLYLDIGVDSTTNKLTQKQLSKKYAVSPRTVLRALDWCRDNGIFAKDASLAIKHHIVELKKQLDWLRDEIQSLCSKQVEKDMGNGKIVVFKPSLLTGLSKELRETRALLMELEGAYKKTLGIEHSGSVTIERELDGLSDDQLKKELDELQGKSDKKRKD